MKTTRKKTRVSFHTFDNAGNQGTVINLGCRVVTVTTKDRPAHIFHVCASVEIGLRRLSTVTLRRRVFIVREREEWREDRTAPLEVTVPYGFTLPWQKPPTTR